MANKVENVNKSLSFSYVLDQVISPTNKVVYEKLSELGCCKLCALRFSGETATNPYKILYETKTSQAGEGINESKRVAGNPCVACLGMLQPPTCDRIIEEIANAITKEEYDNPSFNVAFTLPISFYLRAHSLLVFVANNFPDYFKTNHPVGVVTVGVKDAWKYVFAHKLAKRINKTFHNDASLKTQVDIQYEDDHAEIACLLDMYPNTFKDQKIKAKKLRNLKGPTMLFSRKNVETLLQLNDREHFSRFYPVPPSVPSHSAMCNNVLFEQSSIFIAGRYNKFSRVLPQTPWLVEDERRLETSVHELIAGKLEALAKSSGSKLISSGREDVDVRMLGSGRPFAVELLTPRHVTLTGSELVEAEREINSGGLGRVAVSGLKLIPKSVLDILKHGEEHKTKTYEAYCCAQGVDTARLSNLHTRAPVTLQQKTPVRVLHRRPIATRPRVVHWMKVQDVKHCPENESTYFKLTLNTQAGTYIKEFIHGDFGRTQPSLGDLVGGAADCLALDVQSIELKWPV